MVTKNVFTMAALASTLLLAACTDEESTKEAEETDKVEASETEESDEKVYDKNGDVIEDLSKTSFSKNELDDEYEALAKRLKGYELPKEGRLSEEDAIEMMGIEDEAGFPIVAYENGMIFNGNTKELEMQAWIDGERPYPHGTQVLGFFKTIVKTTTNDLQTEGTGQGIELKPLEEYTKSEREYIADGHGWDILKQKNEYALKQFRQFETYFRDNKYYGLASWTAETVDHFEKGASLEQSEWEEAYERFYQGVHRVLLIDQSISK